MNKQSLETAIIKSGWKGAWEEQIEGLLSKLNFLASTGRYGQLLANIEASTDKNNFLASVLEATIAFQFESAGIKLDYEIRQIQNNESSIDFRWVSKSGKTVYVEVRLLQQDQATTNSIESQLKSGNIWSIGKDGDGEQQDIIRVQRAILEKLQKKDGTPTKFLTIYTDCINIVAVDVSRIILGTFDLHDCLLVARGDPSVHPACRRDIFGLFQEYKPEYPDRIQSLAQLFAHLRNTLHGILFVFKHPNRELFNYSVGQVLIWNYDSIEKEVAEAISEEIILAIPLVKE